MTEVLSKVQSNWITLNSSSDLASMSSVDNFVERYAVKLPNDLLQYFTLLNGTGGEYDDELFQFYSLAEIIPLSDLIKDTKSVPNLSLLKGTEISKKDIFIFANYQFSLFCYGVNLDPDRENDEVYIFCEGDHRILCNSFTEFLSLYLDDSKLLYFN